MKEKIKITSIYYFVVISILSIISTFVYLFCTHGMGFNKIFLEDSLDTGMDFFHSIEYVRGRMPYEKYETLYPPLANLFFLFLYRFVPNWQSDKWKNTFKSSVKARGTKSDLRLWQPTLMLYVFLIVVSIIMLYILINKYFDNYNISTILFISSISSYGIIYSIERGNIIIISMLLSLFFIMYRKDDNAIVRELALISLALAAGLKLYPAFFGFLLLYDKDYKKAFRAVVYGILCFVLPVFAFKEGLNGIKIFFDVLLKFGSTDELDLTGFSADRIYNVFVYMFSSNKNSIDIEKTLVVGRCIALIATIILLLSGFFLEKEWQQLTCCGLAMVIYQAQGIYILTIMLIPMLAFLKKEDTLNKKNIIPFILLCLTQITLPIPDKDSEGVTFAFARLQIAIMGLYIYIAVNVFKNLMKRNVLKIRI